VILALLALNLVFAAAWTDVALLARHLAVDHRRTATVTGPRGAPSTPHAIAAPDARHLDRAAGGCRHDACDDGFCADCARLAARSIAVEPGTDAQLMQAVDTRSAPTNDGPRRASRGRLRPVRAPPTSSHHG
jgi:hypothetical protein